MKEFDYAAPRTLSEALALLAENGERARVLAGGTDLIVQLREGRCDADLVVDVKRIPELNELAFDPAKGLFLGAAVPCYRIYENAEIAGRYPGLIDAVSMIGGIQIQSRASVGGNLCNASPAADTIPPLIVHRAVCVIAGPKGQREVPVEQFCVGPGKTILRAGEILVGLKIPVPPPRFGASYLRFIPRNEMDIAVAGAAVAVALNADKTRCEGARVALSAVAPTPLLVSEAGDVLINGPLNEKAMDQMAQTAQQAAKPIDDMRGTAEFRRHLVGVLTRRALRNALARAVES
ncbi:MAG: oxidoreductase [Gemmatales bacterium]|nr:MAG: oxidoreductase [Gemmatales bacterium]